MIVCRVIELLKSIKPLGEVRSEVWGMIISQRPLVQVEDVVIVVGKTGNFLRNYKHVHNLQDTPRTLGLRIAALEPANLLTGRTAKLLIVAGIQARFTGNCIG